MEVWIILGKKTSYSRGWPIYVSNNNSLSEMLMQRLWAIPKTENMYITGIHRKSEKDKPEVFIIDFEQNEDHIRYKIIPHNDQELSTLLNMLEYYNRSIAHGKKEFVFYAEGITIFFPISDRQKNIIGE